MKTNALEKSNFVVVLSGDVARFESALNILEKGKADKMIVTAGKTPWEKKQDSDGHQYIKIAKQRGVKSEKILITGVVHNTEQEALKIKEMIPIDSELTLVTSAVHMTRAKMLFEKAGFTCSKAGSTCFIFLVTSILYHFLISSTQISSSIGLHIFLRFKCVFKLAL